MSNKEIKPHITNEIDNFVKKLSRNIDADSIEINEFEEEMKSNLLCSFTDLLNEGYSESEALSIAFSKFGHIDYLKNDLRKLYNLKSIFSKILLRTTIVIGVISAVLFTTFFAWNFLFIPWHAENTFGDIKTEVEKTDDINDKEFKESIKSIVDRNPAIYSIAIMEIEGTSPDDDPTYKLLYRYPIPQSDDYWKSDVGKESFFIFKDEYYSSKSGFDLSGLNYHATLSLRNLDYNFLALAQILLAVYWTLFSVWGALKIYLSDDDKNLWILLFALTNIVGYMIYRFTIKKK